MSVVVVDPLHALSLARTALSDPDALPCGTDIERKPLAPPGVDAAHVAYAIAHIDRAIDCLYFEPFGDPAGEAGWTLATLGRLLARVAEGLDECGRFGDAAAKTRDAVAEAAVARVLLASAIDVPATTRIPGTD